MVSQLDISNVINISVTQSAQALNAFNTSNLALFTNDTPAGSFPSSQGYQLYLTPSAVATDFGSTSVTAQMASAVFAQQPNLLAGGGCLAVIPLLSMETLDTAFNRMRSTVAFYGMMANTILSGADLAAVSADLQAYNAMGFFVQRTSGSIAAGGALDLLRTGSLTKSRGLYYDSATDLPALLFQAAYAGKALSTNFNGSNTTTTMHLKPLAVVQPDPNITQSILATAQTAGADCYVSVEGIPVVFCSGANAFFDQIYNLGWLIGALQVAGFNYLSGSATKIPQTESGMSGLKGAYAQVCQQAVTNQYAAPGSWTSATTFGNQADLISNIAQIGWYMYSQPIAQQAASARTARQAPLVQIAIKEAGAFHSSSVIVNVNQ